MTDSPRTTTDDSQRIAALQRQYGLSYHVVYAFLAETEIGLRGKRVLEVGGSLPRGFVIDELGTRQWIGLEEMTHYEQSSSESFKVAAPPRKLGEVPNPASLGDYEVLAGAIEDWPDALAGHFDAIFSIATFEHILLFPQALDRMFASLRAGGKLFAMFSPIWSAHDGHHLPRILNKATGQMMDFQQSPIPPWGHLVMRPPQMMQHLLQSGLDLETATRVVYYVYHSTNVNRLFTEDYVAYFHASRFRILKLLPTFQTPLSAEGQAELARLHPGRQHFANNGMLAVLERAE